MTERFPQPDDSRRAAENNPPGRDGAPLRLDDVIKAHIAHVLRLTNGRIHGPDGAAALLGVNASTLRHKMDKLHIPYRKSGRRE